MNSFEIRGQAKLFLDVSPFRICIDSDLKQISDESLELKLNLPEHQGLKHNDLKNYLILNKEYELQIECQQIDWPISIIKAKIISTVIDDQKKINLKFKISRTHTELKNLIDELKNTQH